jgi:hemerythrin-like domain-containing protein
LDSRIDQEGAELGGVMSIAGMANPWLRPSHARAEGTCKRGIITMPTTHAQTNSRAHRKTRSRSATRKTRRPASRRQAGAIALLKSDHQEVADLLKKYESGKNRNGETAKKELAEEICHALSVHASIEEEIFYPAVAQQVEDAGELVEEARVEHASLKNLIAQIENSDPGGAQYDAEVKVLGEYVKHHVKEEESKIFPKLRKGDLDLEALGEQLSQRKNELMSE